MAMKTNEMLSKFLKWLLPSLLILCSAVSLAAGFDCGKGQYELAISAVENPRNLMAAQRKWLAETRSRCSDKVCLSEVYRARVAWLKDREVKHLETCDVEEGGIIGSWRRLKGGDFEELAFAVAEGERSFISWLHHSPELIGVWELKNCVLHVTHRQNQQLDFHYKVLGLQSDVLLLENTDSGEKSSYRRIRE
jgi:hypothetical protein